MKQPAPIRESTKSTACSGRSQTPMPMRATGTEALVSSTSPKAPPKWAWHYRVLLKVRERLLRDRSEQLREAAEPLEPHSMDIADSATDEFDHNLALSRLSSGQDALYEVEEAIRRIRAGTYGTCEESGQPIPPKRLRAIPWARFCEEVGARLEKTGLVKQPCIGAVASVRGPDVRTIEGAETPGGEEEGEVVPNDEDLRRVFSPRGKQLPPKSAKHSRTRGAGGRETREAQRI